MFGADYARGPVVAGLSLSNSRGLGEYAGAAGGQVASSVTGLYPWLGLQSDRARDGVGRGRLRDRRVAADAGRRQALESGLSMAMAAAGTRGELLAGGASGFELAFKADALWVGTAVDGVDGPAGRLKATDAAVARFRTGLEGSRAYNLASRLSLKPSVEVGLRHDGGDAETGAGMDVGAGMVLSDAATGLAVDVRVRTLLVHEDENFSERGVAVSLSYNPTPSTPLGFLARVAPSWGGQATSGAQALWGRETMAGMAHGGVAQGNSLDAEVGYGLPVGSRLVGTPTLGLRTSEYGQDYRLGYGLGVLDRESLNFQLGVEAQRRNSPVLGGARDDPGLSLLPPGMGHACMERGRHITHRRRRRRTCFADGYRRPRREFLPRSIRPAERIRAAIPEGDGRVGTRTSSIARNRRDIAEACQVARTHQKHADHQGHGLEPRTRRHGLHRATVR